MLNNSLNIKPITSPVQKIKQDLAAAYRIFAQLGMDDLTYTHLSARLPGESHYYIYPFGHLFEEVTASSLLKVSLDGTILEGTEFQYNRTGYVIHGAIYETHPEINAIIHLHTTAGVAVSSQKCGLLPISQFALHFYNRISYHPYDSLALDYVQQGKKLASDLGQNKAMILENHGTLTCGTTLPEAFLYMHFLEQSCRVQCAALATGQSLHLPPHEVCEKAAQDLRDFEPQFGMRDWTALVRKLDTQDSSYKK